MAPVIFSTHALTRCFERGIAVDAVLQVVATGEVIEYQDNGRRLLLGVVKDLVLHVIIAIDGDATVVVTVYEPDPLMWDASFTRRMS
jgi:hypothetical protein